MESSSPIGVVGNFLQLIRFSHSVFALPFALLAAVLAWQHPDSPFSAMHLVGIVGCMILARSAAMAFNRLVDASFDASNPRTAGRHIPAGLLSKSSVTWFVILTSAGFVATTLLFLPNRWPVILSVPVLLFLLGYSYAKRFTAFSHYWLSAALMLSPIAAWIAIRGEVHAVPIWLAAVIFFWVGGFDILYACQDADFDRASGLHSLPARLGIRNALRVAALSHLVTVVCLIMFWQAAGLGTTFLAGVAAIGLALVYEHLLVRPENLSRVNIAFFYVNAVISIGLLAFGVIDLSMRN